KLALRDFALPSPRTGHIETNSGYGSSLQEGMELHQLIQKKKASEDSSYKAEVKITHEFERADFKFIVEGRIDGLYQKDIPHLEEIKSTFNVWEMALVLREKDLAHPYCLQLATYGYLFWLNENVAPTLSFHLA